MRLHGKNGQIYLNGSLVTVKNEWSISIERDYADVTVFADEGKTFVPGLGTAKGSFSGLLEVGGEVAFSASTSGIPITIAIYSQPGSLVCSGKGYVDAQATGAVADAVRCSATIVGIGKWVWA